MPIPNAIVAQTWRGSQRQLDSTVATTHTTSTPSPFPPISHSVIVLSNVAGLPQDQRMGKFTDEKKTTYGTPRWYGLALIPLTRR